MTKIIAIAILASTALAGQAFASETASCTNAPKSQWMSKSAVKSKYEKMGYKVRSVSAEKSCYEIFAFDKSGKRVIHALNPVNGAVVNAQETN